MHAWFQAHQAPWATQLMLVVTWWHATFGLLAMVGLLALAMWRLRDGAWLPVLLAGVPGAMLLNAGAKQLVQRARPHVDHPLLFIESYSFPSGHAAGTAALYACATAWLLSRLPRERRTERAALVVAAIFLTLWVSLSRVYLGVHYASDVVAGMGLGLVWALGCVAVGRRRTQRAAGGREAA